MTLLDAPRFRTGYLVISLFCLFAGDALRYSVSWYGFGVVAVSMTMVSVLLLVATHRARRWSLQAVPIPLILFLAVATGSVAWSFYPGATLLGILVTWMTVVVGAAIGVCFTTPEILRALGLAFRAILGLSLLFELVVATLVRAPLLPFFTLADISSYEKIPKLLYWSRNLLFEGGKIQGIVGNSSLLAFVALIALIVFSIQFAARTVRRVSAIAWIVVALAVLVLTRSATVIVGVLVVAAVAVALLVLRASRRRWRIAASVAISSIAAGAVATALLMREPILGLLGKSSDLTGRLDIWNAVMDLASARPVFGWGWVSWWVPWVAPFDTLAFESGVRQLHAHNAWLDVWLQLGILGLVLFGALVLSTLVRSWQIAVDRPQFRPNARERYSAVSLLWVLVLVALLVQSAAESRLLVEYGLALLVIVSFRSKIEAS